MDPEAVVLFQEKAYGPLWAQTPVIGLQKAAKQ